MVSDGAVQRRDIADAHDGKVSLSVVLSVLNEDSRSWR